MLLVISTLRNRDRGPGWRSQRVSGPVLIPASQAGR